LRLHTDYTCEVFRKFTTFLGKSDWDFGSKVCASYSVLELPKERSARLKRQSKSTAKSIDACSKGHEWKLDTYKFHNYGHYYFDISRISTTDIGSAQRVSIQVPWDFP